MPCLSVPPRSTLPRPTAAFLPTPAATCNFKWGQVHLTLQVATHNQTRLRASLNVLGAHTPPLQHLPTFAVYTSVCPLSHEPTEAQECTRITIMSDSPFYRCAMMELIRLVIQASLNKWMRDSVLRDLGAILCLFRGILPFRPMGADELR